MSACVSPTLADLKLRAIAGTISLVSKWFTFDATHGDRLMASGFDSDVFLVNAQAIGHARRDASGVPMVLVFHQFEINR